MTRYSIIKVGNEFIVQAEEHDLLKVNSIRKANKIVSDARQSDIDELNQPLQAPIETA